MDREHGPAERQPWETPQLEVLEVGLTASGGPETAETTLTNSGILS